MKKYRIFTTYSLTHTATHEAEDDDGIALALENGEIETDASICAQCCGWGQDFGLEVGEPEYITIATEDGETVHEEDWHYCPKSREQSAEIERLKAEIKRLTCPCRDIVTACACDEETESE